MRNIISSYPIRIFAAVFIAAFSVSLHSNAQTTVSAKLGSGIRFTAADSSFSLKLGTRFQTLYRGIYDYDNESYADAFLIRRARIKLEGFVYSPDLEYKLQFDLSNVGMGSTGDGNNNAANMLLDAAVKWNFAENFTLQFGQEKLPGNREESISSQKLQFVDRSLLNSRYALGRDLGLQLQHSFLVGNAVVREIVSISRGKGRNITEDYEGGYDYTGRIELLPFGEFKNDGDYSGSAIEREGRPKLALGFAYDYNTGASRERGQSGDFLSGQRKLKTLYADAMFKYGGFSAMAEYADRKTSGSPVIETDGAGTVTEAFYTGTGFNVQAGYLFKNNIEIAGRYTHVSPQNIIQKPDNTEYTLGVSKYLAGHTLKVQSDISWLKDNTSLDQLMYRFQVEIGF